MSDAMDGGELFRLFFGSGDMTVADVLEVDLDSLTSEVAQRFLTTPRPPAYRSMNAGQIARAIMEYAQTTAKTQGGDESEGVRQLAEESAARKDWTGKQWEYKWIWVALEIEFDEEKSGFLGGRQVDWWYTPAPTEKTEKAWKLIQQLGCEGWETVAATPVVAAHMVSRVNIAGGCSFTKGIWVLLKRTLEPAH